jgi:dipeptidase E
MPHVRVGLEVLGSAGAHRADQGIVDFSICPHLAQEDMPGNSMAEAESWAAGIPNPAYAIDDDTAIKVSDGTVEVISEGHWRLFTP